MGVPAVLAGAHTVKEFPEAAAYPELPDRDKDYGACESCCPFGVNIMEHMDRTREIFGE